jgi:hypothetical protein
MSCTRNPPSPSFKKMPLQQFWVRTLTLIVIVHQSAYWGYRFGKEDCLFQECSSLHAHEAIDAAVWGSPIKQVRSNLDLASNQQPRRGIVLTSQCSGSEWVASSLNNIPGVTWHLERMIRYSKTYMKDAEWEKVTWNTYQEELERAFTFESGGEMDLPEITPQDVNYHGQPIMVGFKLMYDQIPQHLRLRFAQWLEENQVFVVHLRRRCAALQWASQMDKYMRKYRQKIKKDHIYSKEEAAAMPAKDWEITLLDKNGPGALKGRWLESIQLLEDNQNDFANYLHVYAAKVAVFDFNYETVDGLFQTNWFNALYAFLGLNFQHPTGSSKTVKTGSRTCEDRMAGLGGPALPLLDNMQSQVECLRMKSLAMAGNSTSSAEAMKKLGLGALMVPPNDGRCRLGPNCRQMEYGKYQDELLTEQQLKVTEK